MKKMLLAVGMVTLVTGGTVAGDHSEPLPLPRDPNIAVMEEYKLFKKRGTREALELFIARHPDHALAEQARQDIIELENAAE
jgi:hypothetical protein